MILRSNSEYVFGKRGWNGNYLKNPSPPKRTWTGLS